MSVKVNKLWGDPVFNTLTENSKLFYIFLNSNPQTDVMGVFVSLDKTIPNFSWGLDIIRSCIKELTQNNLLKVVAVDSKYYYLSINFFNKRLKSDSHIKNVWDCWNRYPDKIKEVLTSYGIEPSIKPKESFIKPSVEEVSDFFIEEGYNISASDFHNYYEETSKNRLDGLWQDNRGKVIKDWKAKARRVWFKPDRKVKVLEGCPKGYEKFSIDFMGNTYLPEKWVDGLPYHSNYGINKMMKKEFNN